jgi:hypothetical protein
LSDRKFVFRVNTPLRPVSPLEPFRKRSRLKFSFQTVSSSHSAGTLKATVKSRMATMKKLVRPGEQPFKHFFKLPPWRDSISRHIAQVASVEGGDNTTM